MKIWFLSFLCLAFLACQENTKPYRKYIGSAQGTTYSISVDSEKDFRTAIDSIFLAIDNSMSLWVRNSLINQLNASSNGVKIDGLLQEVFKESVKIQASTDGAFDISIGPVIKLWGFIRKNGLPVPPEDSLKLAREFTGMHNFQLLGDSLNKLHPKAEIDVNAIAQGYTVDVLAAYLDKNGIENYLIELGGEVLAKGINDRDELWKVGIEQPDFSEDPQKNPLQLVVALENVALVTSGSYRKFIEVDGKKYSHTIDPKTSKPVRHSLLSVSVIHKKCSTADALATAFMVMGTEKAIEKAKELGVEIFCIYDQDGELKTAQTDGFQKYIL